MLTTRVGGNNHGKGRNCYKHLELGNIPNWGATNQNHAFRQYLCCTSRNFKPPADTVKWFDTDNSGYKQTMSWSQAKAFCVSSGYKNLCTAKQCVMQIYGTSLPGTHRIASIVA